MQKYQLLLQNRDQLQSIWIKGYAIAPIPFFLFALLANAYLGFFARYAADDYCTTAILITNGFIAAQQHWYFTWTGRFSFTLAVTLVELIGPPIVPVLPLATLAIWLAITAWTISQLRKLAGLGPSLVVTILFATMIIFGAIGGAPVLEQSLLWQTGMLTYLAPLIVLTFTIGLICNSLTRQSQSSSPLFLILCAILTLFAGGFSETYLALQTTVFCIAVVLCSIASPRSKSTLFPMLVAGLAGSILAMAIIYFAPGNAIRQTYFPQSPGLISILQSSTRYSAHFVKYYITDTEYIAGSRRIVAVLFFLSLLCAFLLPSERIQTITRRGFQNVTISIVFIIPLLSFMLIVACFAPGVYGISTSLPGRALQVPLFVLILTVIVEGYLVGLVGKQFQCLWGVTKSLRAIIILSFILATLLYVGPITLSRWTLDKAPKMSTLAAMWDEQDLEIRSARQAGLRNLILPSLQHPLGFGALETDPSSWVNKCVAIVYDVESIIAR